MGFTNRYCKSCSLCIYSSTMEGRQYICRRYEKDAAGKERPVNEVVKPYHVCNRWRSYAHLWIPIRGKEYHNGIK